MNLTKCFAVGLCLTAMTASAVIVKSDSFESGFSSGWDGTPAGARIDGDASLDGYMGTRPMTGVTSNKLVKLDTEGGVWTNKIGVSGQSFETTPVYCDMLVKFVPSEELPTLTEGKLALAIKAGAGGTNFLNIAHQNGPAIEWVQTARDISTSAWYRVTVKMYWDVDLESTYGLTFINGTAVGSALRLDGNTTLNSIGFQGTGYIDEVVVRDDSPFVVQFAGSGAVITDTNAYDTWLTTHSLTRETVQLNQYNAFLFGVAPDPVLGSPNLKVSSITVGGNVVLTLAADYSGVITDVALNPANFNNGAVVTVRGKVNVQDLSWTDLGSPLTFNPTVGATTYNFFTVGVAVP